MWSMSMLNKNGLYKVNQSLLNSIFNRTIFARGNRQKFEEKEDTEKVNSIDGFRVIELQKKGLRQPKRDRKKRTFDTSNLQLERYRYMSVDQDWTDVWPTSSVFKHSVVPLPIHQGKVRSHVENGGIPPGKYANAELMKIPNFFHLTPNHIKKHCEALKKFCTPWPIELKTDEDCKKHFPIEISTTDYLFAGPSIRDERSRIVNLKIPLDALNLDQHANDKLILLAGENYDPKTNILSLTSDKCPYRKQNLEYINYLLTVLYHESWKIEDWEESEITEADRREYIWEKSASKKNIINLIAKAENKDEKMIEESINDSSSIKKYGNDLKKLFDVGETEKNLEEYKKSVLNLLKLDKINTDNKLKANKEN